MRAGCDPTAGVRQMPGRRSCLAPSASPCSSPTLAASCRSGLAGSGRSGERGPGGLSQLPSRCRGQRPRPQLQPQRDEGVKATCAPYTPQSGVTLAPQHHLVPINTCKQHGASHGKVPGALGRQSRRELRGPSRTHPSLSKQTSAQDVRSPCGEPGRSFPLGISKSRPGPGMLPLHLAGGCVLLGHGRDPRDFQDHLGPAWESPPAAKARAEGQTPGCWLWKPHPVAGSRKAIIQDASGSRAQAALQPPVPGMPQHSPRRCP